MSSRWPSTIRRRSPWCPRASPTSSTRHRSGLRRPTPGGRCRTPNWRNSGPPPGGAWCRPVPTQADQAVQAAVEDLLPEVERQLAVILTPDERSLLGLGAVRAHARRGPRAARQGSLFEADRTRPPAAARGSRERPAARRTRARGAEGRFGGARPGVAQRSPCSTTCPEPRGGCARRAPALLPQLSASERAVLVGLAARLVVPDTVVRRGRDGPAAQAGVGRRAPDHPAVPAQPAHRRRRARGDARGPARAPVPAAAGAAAGISAPRRGDRRHRVGDAGRPAVAAGQGGDRRRAASRRGIRAVGAGRRGRGVLGLAERGRWPRVSGAGRVESGPDAAVSRDRRAHAGRAGAAAAGVRRSLRRHRDVRRLPRGSRHRLHGPHLRRRAGGRAVGGAVPPALLHHPGGRHERPRGVRHRPERRPARGLGGRRR